MGHITVKCKHCDRSFKGQPYLDSHVQFKHPASGAQNSNSISSAPRNTLVISVISQAIRGCYLKLLTNYFRNRKYNNILPVFLIPPALRMHSTIFSSVKLTRYTMHLQRKLLRMTSLHLILPTDLCAMCRFTTFNKLLWIW